MSTVYTGKNSFVFVRFRFFCVCCVRSCSGSNWCTRRRAAKGLKVYISVFVFLHVLVCLAFFLQTNKLEFDKDSKSDSDSEFIG